MRTNGFPKMFLAIGLLAGCVPSVNPVYRNEDLVYDPALLGVWSQPNSTETWEVTHRDGKSYRIVHTDAERRQGRFVGHLVDVEGTRLLDLAPDDTDRANSGIHQFHEVPIHTIYRVRRTQPTLELAAIDYKWLEKYLEDNPQSIPHARFDSRLLLTGSTGAVQAFVLAHKEMFTGAFNLQRREKRG
jgi:hypothetical protein